jgi:hypothetical protein
MSRRAETIKAAAKMAGQKMRDIDGRHSYAAEAGALSAHVEILCEELEAYTGANHKTSKGVRTATLGLGDAEVLVEYEYEAEEPMVWRYADGSGHPGCPASAQVISVLINGAWIDPTFIESSTLDRWSEELCERMDQDAADARADRDEYESDRRRDEECEREFTL